MNTEGSLADAKAERVKLTKSLKVANSKLSKKQVASGKKQAVSSKKKVASDEKQVVSSKW